MYLVILRPIKKSFKKKIVLSTVAILNLYDFLLFIWVLFCQFHLFSPSPVRHGAIVGHPEVSPQDGNHSNFFKMKIDHLIL